MAKKSRAAKKAAKKPAAKKAAKKPAVKKDPDIKTNPLAHLQDHATLPFNKPFPIQNPNG